MTRKSTKKQPQEGVPHALVSRSLGNKPLRSPSASGSRSAKGLRSSERPPQGKDHVMRVAITGAAGQIAYSLLGLLLSGSVFGQGVKLQLRLLDIEACAQRLEGVAMEIQDCRSDLVTDVVTTSDPETAFEGADIAVLLGGYPRLPGMERGDLVVKNVPIMAEHGKALAKTARADVRVLVVANPACTNCLVASACAPSIPANHFSSLARLDEERLAAMVTEKVARVVHSEGESKEARALPSPSEIEIRGAYLWGNHSPTMCPDLSAAEVRLDGLWLPLERVACAGGGEQHRGEASGTPSPQSTEAWAAWVSAALVPAVRARGTQVMDARGKSSALSAANAIAKHLRDWLSPVAEESWQPDSDGRDYAGHDRQSPRSSAHRDGAERERHRGHSPGASKDEGARVSMGVFSDGNPYGVPDGLVCSFPVVCGGGRHRFIEGLAPDRGMLDASVRELLEEKREALSLLEGSFLE